MSEWTERPNRYVAQICVHTYNLSEMCLDVRYIVYQKWAFHSRQIKFNTSSTALEAT